MGRSKDRILKEQINFTIKMFFIGKYNTKLGAKMLLHSAVPEVK